MALSSGVPMDPPGLLDVGAAVDQRGRHVGVVAACRPVQRRLAWIGRRHRVQVGARFDQQPAICGPSGK